MFPVFLWKKRKGNWAFQNLLKKNRAAFIWQGKSQPKPTDLNSHSTDSTASTSIVFWLQLRGGVMISHDLAFICAIWDFCSNSIFQGVTPWFSSYWSMNFLHSKKHQPPAFSALRFHFIFRVDKVKHFPAEGGRGFSAVSLGTFFFGWSNAITNTSTKAWYVKMACQGCPGTSRSESHGSCGNFQCPTCSTKNWVGWRQLIFITFITLSPLQPSKSERNLSRINLLKESRSSSDTFQETTDHPHHLVLQLPPHFRSPKKLLMSKEVCECFLEFQDH